MTTATFTIDTTHGIVEAPRPDRFIYRNLLDRQRLADHFRRRTQPYVPLAEAIIQGGDAFTLDDSTVTAADAARLARAHGHAVTLFINGYNIVHAQPYFFSRLNVALDETDRKAVAYRGQNYDLSTTEGKERFRGVIKRQLSRLGQEEQRQALVTEVGKLLGLDSITVPPFLRPITLAELRGLVALGVDIQNHGWSHVRVGGLPPDEHAEEIRRGRAWLQQTCGIEADLFAIPNGDGLPFWRQSPHYRAWFLLATGIPLGEVAPGIYNRQTLDL